jgi:hypothetical protein
MVVGMARRAERMKGQGVPMWTYLVLAATAILIAVYASPFYQSVEFAKANNARLEAQSIAGVINMMKSSTSSDFQYQKSLPRTCTMDISDLAVNVTIKTGDQETSYVSNIIQNNVKLARARINCETQRTLKFSKTGNVMWVEGA